MLDKDRIAIVLEILEGGGSLCETCGDAVREKLRIYLADLKEQSDQQLSRMSPHSIGRSIGKYLYRKATANGTGKDQFVKHCIPMVLQKSVCEVSPDPDFEMAARNLCTEMWEENAG